MAIPEIRERDLPSKLRYCAKALTDLGGKVPDEILATVGGVSFMLHQIADAQPQWTKFDKDDEESYPPKVGEYWTYFAKRVERQEWYGLKLGWQHFAMPITHWKPIEVPVPPERQ